MGKAFLEEFLALNIAIITISDTRDEQADTSGATLKNLALKDGHNIVHKEIVKDNIDDIVNLINKLSNNSEVDVIITTGGTGFTKRDNTKAAIAPLLVKQIEGFGELFRRISYDEIGTSTMQSNAFAGFCKNKKLIFCIPGSTGACKTAYTKILGEQLNSKTKPCNFATLIKRNFI